MTKEAIRANDRSSPTVAFEGLYSDWLSARAAVKDETRDDSEATTNQVCGQLYVAEDALLQASTPSKGLLKHKFKFLRAAIESECEGDIKNAVTSIQKDLRRFGFALP